MTGKTKRYRLLFRQRQRWINSHGECKCADPRCESPEINTGDIVVTRQSSNRTLKVCMYHEKCAELLNII